MKTNYFSMRAAMAAIAALCGAIVVPTVAHAVGAVSVNGNAVCASSTNMSLNPSGDIVISCTPAGGGGGGNPTAPVCSVNISASPITAGSQSAVTAVCTPAATSWVWSVSTGGPAMSGASALLTFPSAGTFTYTVTASAGNLIGAPASNTIIVNAAGGGGGGGGAGCSNPTAVAGAFSGNGTKLIAIDRGASVSYSLPVYNAPGRTLEMLSIQSTASQQDLTAEFSVSTCPGDFDNMQADCKTWGTVNQSGTQLIATTSGSTVAGTCTVILGQQYYLNVRNTKFDRVTPACTQANTCYMNLQLNSY